MRFEPLEPRLLLSRTPMAPLPHEPPAMIAPAPPPAGPNEIWNAALEVGLLDELNEIKEIANKVGFWRDNANINIALDRFGFTPELQLGGPCGAFCERAAGLIDEAGLFDHSELEIDLVKVQKPGEPWLQNLIRVRFRDASGTNRWLFFGDGQIAGRGQWLADDELRALGFTRVSQTADKFNVRQARM